MAPLRHAMRLVDHEDDRSSCSEGLEELTSGTRSGVTKTNSRRLSFDVLEGLVGLAGGQRAVHLRGVEPESAQLVDLILHQGDERRYHEGHAGEVQRRQLVAERLASSRGHDGQGVAALHRGSDDFLLSGPEFVETEHALQRAAQGRHIGCASHGRRQSNHRAGQAARRACRQAGPNSA